MAQMSKVGAINTTTAVQLFQRFVKVTYDKTDVVVVQGNRLTLDTGGYYTKTTKTRMNQASNQFELKYWVFQRNKQWFVEYRGEVLPFVNGKCEILLED